MVAAVRTVAGVVSGDLSHTKRNGWDVLPPRSNIRRGACYHLTLSLISYALNTHAITYKRKQSHARVLEGRTQTQ